MKPTPDIGITRDIFRRVAKEYGARWGVGVVAATTDGEVVFGSRDCCRGCTVACRRALRHAIAEGLRWGEPTIYEHSDGRLLWAVPLMHNAAVLGGLAACIADEAVFPPDGSDPTLDLSSACADLRACAESENLTNAALLEKHRYASQREQKRAEAIHDIKNVPTRGILEAYLREEPELLSAIRRGNRADAVGVLNRILVEVYHHGAGRLDLIKSLVMELVVSMCRTAAESGGAPEEVLGSNYRSLAELGPIASEEALSAWLAGMLNRILDHIERSTRAAPDTDLRTGIEFIHLHYADPIGRDDAARAARMSPSHFSRMLKEKTGRSFTDLLNQIRIDRASEMLRKTDLSLSRIALETGFNDQSYFTKVFRRHTRRTPKEYRDDARDRR